MIKFKRIFLIAIVAMANGSVEGQTIDSTYLDSDRRELDNNLTASFIRYSRKTPNYCELRTVDLKTRFIDQITRYSDCSWSELQDTTFNFLDSNRLINFKVYQHGKLQGPYVKYWPSGLKKRMEFYKADSLVSGHCYDKNGVEIAYFPAEKMPEFPGGMNALYGFLVDNLKYPDKCRRKGIEGRVLVKFIINSDGSVSDLNIKKSVDPLLDAEALRVMRIMPKWIPGQQEGVNVKVQYVLPIRFSLE